MFVIVCLIKTRPHTTFFPCTCSRVFNIRRLFSFFSSSFSLLRRPLAILANSRDDLFNFTSECVSLITIANISDCNFYPLATARLFAIRNGASFSMSTGYVNLQFRPSTKISLMSSACQSLPRRIQSNFFRRPADGLTSSIPYDCLRVLCRRQ